MSIYFRSNQFEIRPRPKSVNQPQFVEGIRPGLNQRALNEVLVSRTKSSAEIQAIVAQIRF